MTLQRALEAGYQLSYLRPDVKLGDTVEMRRPRKFVPLKTFIPSVRLELYDRVHITLTRRADLERLVPDFPQ